MTVKPESRVRSKIIAYLRSRGGKWYVTHGGQYQEAGLPDIIGCYQGRFWAFEVKTPEKYEKADNHGLTALQAEFLREVNDNGGSGYCVCSVGQARGIMDIKESS